MPPWQRPNHEPATRREARRGHAGLSPSRNGTAARSGRGGLSSFATPLRQDNRDTYRYFGSPLYTYSLRQGIDDGFLAPYRVHRIVSTVDATGWRPAKGQLDRYGREIPDGLYETKDFERAVALKARTEAIARNLTEFLAANDRYAKTIVFCVDQEHAEDMRMALNNLNADLTRDEPDYVARIVSDEGKIGRGHLDRFMELETRTPAIVTTSQMLTTGVDVPTCRNIVLVRVINSITEFKQIIGRGTRVRDDYGKLCFNILDYTGSATRLFADPDFDGDPTLVTEQEMDDAGQTIATREIVSEEAAPEEETAIADRAGSPRGRDRGARDRFRRFPGRAGRTLQRSRLGTVEKAAPELPANGR